MAARDPVPAAPVTQAAAGTTTQAAARQAAALQIAQPVRVDSMPAAHLVTTEQQAEAAVAVLLEAGDVAVDCEGALERGGRISLIQLFALGGNSGSSSSAVGDASSSGGICYVFDLHTMEQPVRLAAMRHLARLLESPDATKVLHDCRSDCEALYYLYGIRCSAVWDTQVAFGLLQFLSSVGTSGGGGNGGSSSGEALNAPIGLNPLLQQYQLPLNPLKNVMHARMDREAHLFETWPLEAEVLQYAVADVWQLLPAKSCLEADLGPAAALRVEALSRAYSEWCLDPADRTCAVGTASYAAAVQLPLGEDLQMSIEPPDYRPRYSPALPAAAAGPTAGGEPPLAHQPVAAAAAPVAAADDPDTQLVLDLFPDDLRAAIIALLTEQEASGNAGVATTAAAAGEQPHAGSGGIIGGEGGGLAAGAGVGAGVAGADGLAAADQADSGGSSGASGDGSNSGGGGSGGVQLVEVIVDHGRPVRVRLSNKRELVVAHDFSVEEALGHLAAAKGRLHMHSNGGDLFYSDNWAGIPGTLHRISAMRDRQGGIAGLTYRVGRHVPGVGRLILDILHALSQGHDAGGHEVQDAVSPSLLLLGGPGVGKTTLLRDVANLLSDTFHQKVVVVDTSNEIAGDGREPHACIGSARRMMVQDKSEQHNTMREAVQNHMPDVVIVDEIGSPKEVEASKSIAHRGVVLVGTAHGLSLKALMRNSDLNGLIGGIHQVTLGDEEARRSNNGSKTRTERRGEPAFSTLVEVVSRNLWRVHMSVARSVDDMLAGRDPTTQVRWVTDDGRMMVRLEGQQAGSSGGGGNGGKQGSMRSAVKHAAGRLGKQGEWFQGLLNLAALY